MEEHRIDDRSWRRVGAATLVLGWGGNQFIPLMLLYREVNGFSVVQVDILLAFYVIGVVPGFALSGGLSDRHGRKPVLTVGLALGIVASVILGVGSGNLLLLSVGRLVSGISVAAAMVVGSSWIKEISTATGQGAAGARRSSVALSIGFGGGAGIAGALAQWAPLPTLLPYIVHVFACFAALIVLVRAPETRAFDPAVRSVLSDLRLPAAAVRPFWQTVAPVAPWVFGAATLSFAVGPSLVTRTTQPLGVAFATLATVLTLTSGTIVQLLSAQIDRLARGRSGTVGVLFVALGVAALLLAALDGSVVAVVVAAPLFGVGYGLCMVAGLATVQNLANRDDLAGITALFYALTYAGFFVPVIVAALAPVLSTTTVLLGAGGVVVICGLISRTPTRAR